MLGLGKEVRRHQRDPPTRRRSPPARSVLRACRCGLSRTQAVGGGDPAIAGADDAVDGGKPARTEGSAAIAWAPRRPGHRRRPRWAAARVSTVGGAGHPYFRDPAVRAVTAVIGAGGSGKRPPGRSSRPARPAGSGVRQDPRNFDFHGPKCFCLSGCKSANARSLPHAALL